MVYYAYEPDDYSIEAAWHHGVAGQKWGVRNGPPYPVQSGTKARFVKSKMTDATKKQIKNSGGSLSGKQSKSRKRLASQMSDEALRAAISRLKLEKEYKQLSMEKKNGWHPITDKKDKAEKKTQSLLGKVGDTLASELVKNASSYTQARLAARAQNKEAINKAKVEYQAGQKKSEYAERAKRDAARRDPVIWLNDSSDRPTPRDYTELGERILDAFEDSYDA